MSWIVAIALTALLAAGCFFILVGSLGLLKLSDFFRRLHAPTKASTLGVGSVLVASVGYHAFTGTDPQPRELLITAFLFVTAPISAHLLAMAALALHLGRKPPLPTTAALPAADAAPAPAAPAAPADAAVRTPAAPPSPR